MGVLTNNLVVDTIILASIVLLLFYLKFFVSFQYWKRRNISYLPPSFPLGNISFSRPMHLVCQDIYNQIKYKLKLPYCGVYALTQPYLVLTDQELIKQVLIKDFDVFTDRGVFEAQQDDEPLMKNLFGLTGNEWRKLRSKMSPTFTSGRIKEMSPLMDACGRNLVSVLTKDLSKEANMSIDVKDYLVRYMTEVIGSSVFGMDINVIGDPECEFNQMIQKMGNPDLKARLRIVLIVFYPKIKQFLNISLMDKAVTSFFSNCVRQTIKYRETNKVKRNDFIDILMEIKKDDPDFTDELLTAQCFVFFFAGLDTSSIVLTHILHALANNKDLQTRLRQEIWHTKNKYGGDLTYASYQEMPLLDRVVKESLRMYAPVPQLLRTNSKPWTIPNTDITLEPNTHFFIPLSGLHKDPDIYPNPDTFDPDRFAPENADNMPHYAYLPFGEGPRNCIGKRFANVLLKSGLALLVSSFEWNPDPSSDLQYSCGDINVRLSKPLKLKPTQLIFLQEE